MRMIKLSLTFFDVKDNATDQTYSHPIGPNPAV
jgi:hypothetical protein